MSDVLRLMFMIGSFVAVSLAAALQQPQLARDLGLEQWSADALQRAWFPEPPHSGELDEQDHTILKRIAIKDEVIGELLAGRITLFEAAARFRRLDEEYPIDYQNTSIQVGMEDEYMCNQVIKWVRSRTAEGRGGSENLVERLEDELMRYKQLHGSIVLPKT
jgi:hypothetical protein